MNGEREKERKRGGDENMCPHKTRHAIACVCNYFIIVGFIFMHIIEAIGYFVCVCVRHVSRRVFFPAVHS